MTITCMIGINLIHCNLLLHRTSCSLLPPLNPNNPCAMLKGINYNNYYWFMVLFSCESVKFWDALWRLINTHGMLLSYLSFSLMHL